MERQTAFIQAFPFLAKGTHNANVVREAPSRVHILRKPACMKATPSETSQETFSLRQRREADRELCTLVGVDVTTRGRQTRLFSIDESLKELGRLAETAGMKVVSVITQQLSVPFGSTYIGTGKVKEVREEMESLGCCTCIFDVELSPAQQRTLEAEFGGEKKGIKVLDRTALILDIFAQHAATSEGKLQVEVALYQYRLPRLTRMWTHLERQSGAGGVGLRGPGETQLEVDRRMINTRLTKLKKDLELVRGHRSRARDARRKKAGLPVVALIGYTNAGKSTLMNALTGADALTANALFATLDAKTRRVNLAGMKLTPEILITDTVGFVQNLPTQLVAAFRATLEEVVDADVLLHVVDGSTDRKVMKWQIEAVETVVEELGGDGKPTIMMINKKDLMTEEDVASVMEWVEKEKRLECVCVSGKSGEGLDEVGLVIDEVLRDMLVSVEVVIPYNRGELTTAIYVQGCVQGENFGENGTWMKARIPRSLLYRVSEFCVGADAKQSESEDEQREWKDLAKGRHDK